ncbi:hypothetical protein WME99_06680 [Sorangium sp. So ce136]|uniref:hypothetical protein n=1 Tax=Sorangium sp. So ce136 TaxID=3133284 RepID=UPI003EFF611C
MDYIDGALSGYVYIEQLAPAYNRAGSELMWEAYVPDVDDLSNCSFAWAAIAPDGYGSRFLRQNTSLGGRTLYIPGDYAIRVDVRCYGQPYGSASLAVNVAGDDPTSPYYPPPPGHSQIPRATSSGSPYGSGTSEVCYFWYSYDYDTNSYYFNRSSRCTGGAGRREINTSEWE